jgi:hypothetical protein
MNLEGIHKCLDVEEGILADLRSGSKEARLKSEGLTPSPHLIEKNALEWSKSRKNSNSVSSFPDFVPSAGKSVGPADHRPRFVRTFRTSLSWTGGIGKIRRKPLP